jgi:3-isopropylmalate dehydrogenase
MNTYNVVVIRGDGIGPEIVDATLTVLEAAQERARFRLTYEFVDGGADLYRRAGTNLTAESMAKIRAADALLKGPVGHPDVRFANGTEAGLLGGVLRTGLDTYANVRPVRLLPGVTSPLGAKAGAIDYVIVRENTEGLYLSRGKGVGTDEAMADTMVITRKGTERVVRYAFELARRRNGAPSDGRKRVTCIDKSNVLSSYYLFRKVFEGIAGEYADIEAEYLYVDAAAQALVLRPGYFDVVVTENFIGDILSDLGGATVGGIGLCPSGNIGADNAYFEPIHGSAPDIAGKDVASPISQVLSAAMMLNHLGETAGARLVEQAVLQALSSGRLVLADGLRPESGTRAAGEKIAAVLRGLEA